MAGPPPDTRTVAHVPGQEPDTANGGFSLADQTPPADPTSVAPPSPPGSAHVDLTQPSDPPDDAPTRNTADLPLAGYEILGEIGRGGMGIL